ncbi:concanavalin A-like lectin/glucanase domain-containing protein [Gigaspora rosea]|uniref:Concanavalin A-like lectin/glucanase domain-containing protein n=1 Tax=Gigaspora rosea TaxID=44941 RepID=A0A397VG68_9GLOM|nr:concanavalin A-like lectin/glucanase domain-containing protein [Gigaspora rosea]
MDLELKTSCKNPDDYKAAIVRANHPTPPQCGIFYFEIKIINKGKNGCQESKESEIWGCGYHGDDGYSFCSGGGGPYGPTYTTGDIIGCYLNFIKKMVFYTKNGVNLGIACNLPDNWKGILYPCVGFRSQGGSVKVNFGHKTFKYSEMINEDINNELNTLKRIYIKTKNWIKPNNIYLVDNYGASLDDLTDALTESLKNKPNNAFELNYRRKIFFIMGEYNKALEDLARLLEIEPDNIIALKYRGEINYMMK